MVRGGSIGGGHCDNNSLSNCSLPIDKHKESILYSLERHRVLIIIGETGSGKSTRIPQILFSAGIYNDSRIDKDGSNKQRLIGITQPRRIAAIQLAQRVSQDLGCELGTTVGYAVRFKDVTSPYHTVIKYLTEGLLIREMIRDPLLDNYSVIMVDEVHERNLNTDLILGLLKCVIAKRIDLKLIISSATPNINAIQKFFDYSDQCNMFHGSPLPEVPMVIPIQGKAYSLQIYYKKEPVANYLDACVETVISIHESNRLASGKILIFLTGQEEIELVCERLKDYALASSSRLDLKQLVILPLHAALRPEEVETVFENRGHNERACIVSTNIAETSITIRDIAFVIDCGFVKIKFFDHKTGTDLLVRVPISKNSARQRAGRAGRTRDGKVYRLYTEAEFQKLPVETTPEIQRCSLSEVIMLLKTLGVDDMQGFPLLSAMPHSNLKSGVEVLYALEAIDCLGCLTHTGELMSQLNIDPRLARILVCPNSSSCIQDLCRLVAVLQIKDIYLKPARNSSALWSNSSLAKICVSEGDLPSYLNIMNNFINNQRSLRWAEKHNLRYQALVHATEIAAKLELRLRTLGIRVSSSNGRLITIQKSLVSVLFMNAAYLHPNGDYKTVKGDQIVHVHPTSVYYEMLDRPSYVVFVELLDTSRTYMRHIMSIELDWLLEAAPHFYTFATDSEMRNHI